MDKSFYGKIQAVIDNNEQLKNSYILKAVLESIEYKDEKSYLKELDTRLSEVNQSLNNPELAQIISSIKTKIGEVESGDLDSYVKDCGNEFDTCDVCDKVCNTMNTAEPGLCAVLLDLKGDQMATGNPSYQYIVPMMNAIGEKLSYDCLKESYDSMSKYLNENREKLVLVDAIEYFNKMGAYAVNPKATEILKECLYNKEYNPDAISMKLGYLAENKSIVNLLDTLRSIRAEKTNSEVFDLSESKSDTSVYTYMGPVLMEGASVTMYVDGSFINITPDKKTGNDVKNVINEGSVFKKGNNIVYANVYELTDLSMYKDHNQFYNTVKAFESLGFQLKKGGVRANLNRSHIDFTLNEQNNLDFYINDRKIETISEAKNSDILSMENTATKSCIYNVLENVQAIKNVPFVKFLINEKLGKASMVINLSDDYFVYDFVGENKTNVYKLDAYKLYEFCKNEYGFDISSTFNMKIADKSSKLTEIEENKREIIKTIEAYKSSIAKIDEAKKLDLRDSDVKELDSLTKTLFEGIKTLEEKYGVLCDSEDAIRFSKKDSINEAEEAGEDNSFMQEGGEQLSDGISTTVDGIAGGSEDSGEEKSGGEEQDSGDENSVDGATEVLDSKTPDIEEERVDATDESSFDKGDQIEEDTPPVDENDNPGDTEAPVTDDNAPDGTVDQQNVEQEPVEQEEVKQEPVEQPELENTNEGKNFVMRNEDGSIDDFYRNDDNEKDEDYVTDDEENEEKETETDPFSEDEEDNLDAFGEDEDEQLINNESEENFNPTKSYEDEDGTYYEIEISSDEKTANVRVDGEELITDLPIEITEEGVIIDPDDLSIPMDGLQDIDNASTDENSDEDKKKITNQSSNESFNNGLIGDNDQINEGIIDALKIGLLKNARIKKALEKYKNDMIEYGKHKMKTKLQLSFAKKNNKSELEDTLNDKLSKIEKSIKNSQTELDSLIKEIKTKKPQASATIDKVVAAEEKKIYKDLYDTVQNWINDKETGEKFGPELKELSDNLNKKQQEAEAAMNAGGNKSGKPDFEIGDGEIWSQFNDKGEEIAKVKIVDCLGKNNPNKDGKKAFGVEYLSGDLKGKGTQYIASEEMEDAKKWKKSENQEVETQKTQNPDADANAQNAQKTQTTGTNEQNPDQKTQEKV